ncbi:MAG: hypothetical protein ACRDP6_41275 [Actinoallomurus sp.]
MRFAGGVVLLAGALIPGVAGAADARPVPAAAACAGTSPSDFNGDGFTDVAIGDPDEDVGGVARAGVVHIRYGVAGRVGGGEETTVTQADAGESVESGDRFGAVLKVGYVDGDGCADLVVGVPGKDVGTAADAGQAVYVPFVAGHPGTAAVIDQNSPGVAGAAESGDHFGAAVALSGVKGIAGGIAVGAPDEDIGTDEDAGSVTAIPDPADTTMTSYAIDQDSPGLNGAVEAGDRFGASLSSARPMTDGPLLAVGVPDEDIGTIPDAGMVHVLMTNTLTDIAAVSQDTPEVQDTAEAGDRFGTVVTLGRERAFARMLVGIPGEDHGSVSDSGAVAEFSVGDQTVNTFIEQEDLGGVSEPGDHFGASAAYAGSLDLPTMIIGVPDDHTDPAGVVHTLQSRVDGDTDPPPPTEPRQTWTPASGASYGAGAGGTVS